MLGQPWPILACARMNHIDHCLRDCDSFSLREFLARSLSVRSGFFTDAGAAAPGYDKSKTFF